MTRRILRVLTWARTHHINRNVMLQCVRRLQTHLPDRFDSLAPPTHLHRRHSLTTNKIRITYTSTPFLGDAKIYVQGVRSRYDNFRVSVLDTGSTQVRHLEGFCVSQRKYTGVTPLGFLCFTQEVYRYYDTIGVSLLHTGSTQLQHLQGFFASHKIYTGTTPLGFLRVTQESQVRHLEGFCASQKKYTGTTPLGFLRLTQDRHRHHTFRVSLLLTTPLGFLFFTQEGRRYDTLRVSSLLRTGSTQVRRI